jgi:hypothetical protein
MSGTKCLRPGGRCMSETNSTETLCAICAEMEAVFPADDPQLCADCYPKAELIFDEEMRAIELIRTIRGVDVELYDIKHPESRAEKDHCGQLILIRAGEGFEVKICLRSDSLDWMAPLSDDSRGFTSQDTRLDALIGNVSLLIDSWGGGPMYVDIFYVDKVISTDAEI